MNILYIEHYAGSPSMGMEFRPYYLSREWVKMGHSVTIVAADFSHLRSYNPTVQDDLQEENIDGIKYVWIKTGSYEGNGGQRAITMFKFVHKVRKYSKHLVERFRPDIVIASSTYPLDTYAAQKIRKISKAKYIHEVHDMWPATLYEVGGMSKTNPFVVLMQMAENSAYKKCDDLVALLPYSKDYMVEHGLQPDKFHNIQNGVVEEEWLSDVKIPDSHRSFFEAHKDKFIVGYFGGHALSNALDKLLDAAKQMADPDVLFVLVGKGVEKEALIEKANKEEINNLFFLDSVDKKAVPDLVHHFDCSIMTGAPSPLYRFGLCLNKMYDSMMAGKPVICAMTAPKTLVEEFNCGIQVNEVDADHINEAIESIKNMSDDDRKIIGSNGKKAVLDNFTYKSLAEQFVEVMK